MNRDFCDIFAETRTKMYLIGNIVLSKTNTQTVLNRPRGCTHHFFDGGSSFDILGFGILKIPDILGSEIFADLKR